jgi:hypothetical protein
MEEDWDDKAEPLIGLIFEFAYGNVVQAWEDGVLTQRHIEATELIEGTPCIVIRSCVWAGPGYGTKFLAIFELQTILDTINGVHAGHKTGSHIDENVGRRPNHGVEGGFDFDGRASKLGCGIGKFLF